jgi:hypothetical protein
MHELIDIDRKFPDYWSAVLTQHDFGALNPGYVLAGSWAPRRGARLGAGRGQWRVLPPIRLAVRDSGACMERYLRLQGARSIASMFFSDILPTAPCYQRPTVCIRNSHAILAGRERTGAS